MGNIDPRAKLAIDLEFSQLNGRVMQVEVTHADYKEILRPDAAGIQRVEIDLILPTDVCLTFSGKNMNQDTLLGPDGKITADLYVLIRAITLDGMSASVDPCLGLELRTESGSVVVTNYVGFNGQLILHLCGPDTFGQIMHWNRQYSNRQQ